LGREDAVGPLLAEGMDGIGGKAADPLGGGGFVESQAVPAVGVKDACSKAIPGVICRLDEYGDG